MTTPNPTPGRRWWAPLGLIIVAAALALLPAAAAQASPPLTATQSQAVAQVNAAAAQLPKPQNAGQAQREAAQLLPTVKAAVATGNAAVQQLFATSRDPNVAAALLQAVPVTGSPGNGVGVAPDGNPTGGAVAARAKRQFYYVRVGQKYVLRTHRPLVHAAYEACTNPSGDPSRYTWSTFAGNIAQITTAWGPYCWWTGNPNYFAWYSAPSLVPWTWGVYCLADDWHGWGWDYWPTWLHAMYKATLGVNYAFGCGAVGNTGHAPFRIAAAYFWDHYNDFGF